MKDTTKRRTPRVRTTKAERQLIALEKSLRNIRKLMTHFIREISPKSRHAVKDLKFSTSLKVKASEVTSEDVVEALDSFSIQRGDSGWHAFPPADKIHPTTWNRIRKVMADNGGNWMTQRQAFVFEEDPSHIFKALAQGKLANKKKDRQAFYTPSAYAAKVVQLADVRGKTVLEPSAGHGALADACKAAGADSVTCYEIDLAAYEALRAKGHSAAHADFLDMIPGIPAYERVVMNPPFTKKAFIKHIQHGLKCLAKGGRLVAIIPGDDVCWELKGLLTGFDWDFHVQARGAFKESGTAVQTSILVVNKP